MKIQLKAISKLSKILSFPDINRTLISHPVYDWFVVFIQNKVKADEIQFGFMPGKGTDVIFLVSQLQKKYHGKGNKLCYAFIDLKKGI